MIHIWLVLSLVSFSSTAVADGDSDYRRTLQRSGNPEIAPMEELLAKVRTDYHGHILKVELEDEEKESQAVYEVKVLFDDGSVAEIEYDATTLTILDVEKGSGARQWLKSDD